MRIAAAVFVFVALFPRSVEAQDFERILIPLAFRGEVPGAFGTRWTTIILMFNDDSHEVQFYENAPPAQPLRPRGFTFVQPVPSPTLAAWMYVERGAKVKFGALLRDASRADENAGSEIPVVRESELANRVILPFVPTRGPWRVALRIYAAEATTARVRMYRQDRLDPFVDEEVALSGGSPAIFQVNDLLVRWPQLEATASVRIEIDAAAPVWAMASLTNNVTQLVTVIRPQ